MSIAKIRNLSPKDRATVATAVLLEGADAALYLEADSERGEILAQAAEELTRLEPEIRLCLTATILRGAIAELNNSKVN